MKLSLVVSSPGKGEGKVIPITLSQFLIGRDPQCQLRPASAVISKRHCAILVRNGKVFVRDFDSTNGTFVNEQPVKGERELANDDVLMVGPLNFRVVLEVTPPVNKPTPIPQPPAASESTDDESVAAMLLSIQDEGGTPAVSVAADSVDIPSGSTVMDIPSPLRTGEAEQPKTEPKKESTTKKPAMGNSQEAAKALLDQYTRRPRT
jgi:pSer/pThr/pTyr-binding forkhead associated (FHA) protein